MDEPEAALSPSRQMSILIRMEQLIEKGSQFIIATHSPIIMAYPDAVIYEIKDKLKQVSYEETEHYQVTKAFLTNPARMIKVLLDKE